MRIIGTASEFAPGFTVLFGKAKTHKQTQRESQKKPLAAKPSPHPVGPPKVHDFASLVQMGTTRTTLSVLQLITHLKGQVNALMLLLNCSPVTRYNASA